VTALRPYLKYLVFKHMLEQVGLWLALHVLCTIYVYIRYLYMVFMYGASALYHIYIYIYNMYKYIHTVFIYGVSGREITRYTVMYGVRCIYTVLANPICVLCDFMRNASS
jgi:hypothetical protein